MDPKTTCKHCGEKIVSTIWADWSSVRAVVGRYINQCPANPRGMNDHEPVQA
jgi:hypothetical protein